MAAPTSIRADRAGSNAWQRRAHHFDASNAKPPIPIPSLTVAGPQRRHAGQRVRGPCAGGCRQSQPLRQCRPQPPQLLCFQAGCRADVGQPAAAAGCFQRSDGGTQQFHLALQRVVRRQVSTRLGAQARPGWLHSGLQEAHSWTQNNCQPCASKAARHVMLMNPELRAGQQAGPCLQTGMPAAWQRQQPGTHKPQ